jgi:hypothetical protein
VKSGRPNFKENRLARPAAPAYIAALNPRSGRDPIDLP